MVPKASRLLPSFWALHSSGPLFRCDLGAASVSHFLLNTYCLSCAGNWAAVRAPPFREHQPCVSRLWACTRCQGLDFCVSTCCVPGSETTGCKLGCCVDTYSVSTYCVSGPELLYGHKLCMHPLCVQPWAVV